MKRIIVAIDGHSLLWQKHYGKSFGKVCRYIYVDTGAMYRTVALYAIRNGWMTEDFIDEVELKNISELLKSIFKPMWKDCKKLI